MRSTFEKSLRKEAERIGYSKSSNVRNATLSINNAADFIVSYQDKSTENTDMIDDNPNRVLSSEKYYRKGSSLTARKPCTTIKSLKKFIKKEDGVYKEKKLSRKEKKELRELQYDIEKIKSQTYKEKDLKPFIADKNRLKIKGAFCWLSDKPKNNLLSTVTIFYDNNGKEHRWNLCPNKPAPENDWRGRNKKLNK